MSSPLRRSSFVVPTVLAALAIAGSVALGGCKSEATPAAQMPLPQVSVAAALEREVTEWDEFTGRLEAVESVEVRPRVTGYIESVNFTEGSVVRKGDLLFVIDPRPYRAALDRAQADLERARAEARLAHAQDARAQTLIEAKAISREEFEQRKANTSGTSYGWSETSACRSAANRSPRVLMTSSRSSSFSSFPCQR